jgi:hypothetical protein
MKPLVLGKKFEEQCQVMFARSAQVLQRKSKTMFNLRRRR